MLPSKNTKYFYNDYINEQININNWWDEFWLKAEQDTTNFPPVACLDVVRLGPPNYITSLVESPKSFQ
jgi:hypothetical protein